MGQDGRRDAAGGPSSWNRAASPRASGSQSTISPGTAGSPPPPTPSCSARTWQPTPTPSESASVESSSPTGIPSASPRMWPCWTTFTKGRVDFGVARGLNGRASIQFHPDADRRNRDRSYTLFSESLDIVKKAWTEDAFTHSGEFYRLPRPGWIEQSEFIRDSRFHAPDGELIALGVHPEALPEAPPAHVADGRLPAVAPVLGEQGDGEYLPGALIREDQGGLGDIQRGCSGDRGSGAASPGRGWPSCVQPSSPIPTRRP